MKCTVGNQEIEVRNFPWPLEIFVRDGWLHIEVKVPTLERGPDVVILRDWASVHDKPIPWLYKALQEVLLHELAEGFFVDGKRYDDPHSKLAYLEQRQYGSDFDNVRSGT